MASRQSEAPEGEGEWREEGGLAAAAGPRALPAILQACLSSVCEHDHWPLALWAAAEEP